MSKSNDAGIWSNFIEKCPRASVYHTWEWKELIEKTYGVKVFRLVAKENNTIVGVLPFATFDSVLFGRKIVSLPFSDVGGFCVSDGYSECSKGLVLELLRIAKKLNAEFVELRMLSQEEENLSRLGFVIGFQAFTYRLNTKSPYDKIQAAYSKKIRKNIRKAKKDGLRVREAKKISDVDKYYKLYLGRMKDFGTPPAPLSFWRNMWRIFYPENMMKLIFTVVDDREIAGFISLLFKKNVYFILNVSSKVHWKYRGLNDILFDEYIKYACEHGYESVDFGRTRIDTGVYGFKEKGWGCEQVPLNKYYSFLRGKMRNPLDTQLSSNMTIYAKAFSTFCPTFLAPIFGCWIRQRAGDV
ncbi:MAG TPA: GNAT family N-acetyltransferase [Candidatus Bathyarchaeia archaeon]|nr:GNAT family N-acetyltransferase [Candidatus Bathyarchaeia archaeon]